MEGGMTVGFQRKRRLVAVGGLVLSATLCVTGCHVSTRAPTHVFGEPRSATRAMPVRLRNGAEHDAALERNGRPYILEVERAEGGALLYYGARHSSDRGSEQTADIKRRWKAFKPTVALCEGRQGRHFFGFLVEPFAGLPESTLVHKIGRRDGVPLVSLEPDYADEVRTLLSSHSAEQVALFFFLRVYASEAGGRANESLAEDLLAKRTNVDGLRGSLESLADVDAVWRRDYANEPDWRVLRNEPRQGWLGEVSDASRGARGAHMIRVLIDLVSRGERVLAVVGSGHVIRQEWALRLLLGMQPAWDQPPQ